MRGYVGCVGAWVAGSKKKLRGWLGQKKNCVGLNKICVGQNEICVGQRIYLFMYLLLFFVLSRVLACVQNWIFNKPSHRRGLFLVVLERKEDVNF